MLLPGAGALPREQEKLVGHLRGSVDVTLGGAERARRMSIPCGQTQPHDFDCRADCVQRIVQVVRQLRNLVRLVAGSLRRHAE
jgi:hypothetical protein